MKNHSDNVSRVLEILKKNPRGLNIREISEQTRINRMSVAKYLEVLTVLETVDVRALGNAKLYYLSQRVPIATFLKFTSKHFLVLNKDAVIVQINDKFPREVGLTYGQMMGAPIHELIKERFVNLGEWETALSAALSGREVHIEIADKNNDTIRYFDSTLMPIEFPDHSTGVMILTEEVTEKKRIAAALIESEEKYRGLVENINDIIFSMDLAGILTYIGPQVTRYGYSPEDLIGKHFERIVHPEDLGVIMSNFLTIRESGVYLEGVLFRAPAADGHILWLEGNSMIQKDVSGTHIGITGVLRDITERVEAEKALNESRKRYESLANTFDGLISINTKDHRIEYMSERYIQRKGCNATGDYCYKALFHRDSVCPWCIADRVAKGERVVQKMQSRKDGKWYHVINTPVSHSDGSVSVNIIINDIDQGKKAPENSTGAGCTREEVSGSPDTLSE